MGHRILPWFTHPFLPVGLQGPEPDTPPGGRNTGSRTLTPLPPPPNTNPGKELRGNKEARLPEDLVCFLILSRAGKAREESEVTQLPGVRGQWGGHGRRLSHCRNKVSQFPSSQIRKC